MYKKNYCHKIFIVITLLFSQLSFAQTSQENTKDTAKNKSSRRFKEKFPNTRFLNLEYSQSFNRDFHSRLLEEKYMEGEIKNQFNFIASTNIPVYTKNALSITASGRYQYNRFDFSNLEPITNIQVFEKEGSIEHHYFTTAVSATYFSSLFNKPILYNATLFIDGNDNGFERVKGMLGFSFILKRTASTTMTLGGIALLDVTSQIPLLPTFSYSHKFNNSKWELDFILPQRLLFRRIVGNNSRLSLGSTFGVTGFYTNVYSPGLPKLNEYSQLEIKSGVIYEHRFNHFLIGTLRGGIQNFVSNKLTEKGERSNKFIYKNTQDPTGYFQVGISIDPFVSRMK